MEDKIFSQEQEHLTKNVFVHVVEVDAVAQILVQVLYLTI